MSNTLKRRRGDNAPMVSVRIRGIHSFIKETKRINIATKIMSK